MLPIFLLPPISPWTYLQGHAAAAKKDIALSAKEFSLLEYLMRNKGRVLTRDMIENNLWNFDYEGGTNAVDVYIRYLRKKDGR